MRYPSGAVEAEARRRKGVRWVPHRQIEQVAKPSRQLRKAILAFPGGLAKATRT